MARDDQGHWIALGDRSQGPSGAGYAVENRIVVSRTLPEEFQNLNVVRLASFFIALQNTLASLANNHRDNPRVVLLSPGPRSSRYFEDVYLARYLGYTLVEGGDLTVRGDGVYLKTLGGLLAVDVIFRRMGDARCDPLELRPDSRAGIPGLMQVVRDGRVVVANALGSGFLEAPLLQAFLPDACRFLLGEELKLPSVRTWWCGRPDDLKYVEAHLDQLVVRHAYRHHNVKVHIGSNLAYDERARLIAEMRLRPSQFVAQEPVVGSTAPVLAGDRLQPWHVTLRAFAVATEGDYQIMSCLATASPANRLGIATECQRPAESRGRPSVLARSIGRADRSPGASRALCRRTDDERTSTGTIVRSTPPGPGDRRTGRIAAGEIGPRRRRSLAIAR